jgi:hypothetical protein
VHGRRSGPSKWASQAPYTLPRGLAETQHVVRQLVQAVELACS